MGKFLEKYRTYLVLLSIAILIVLAYLLGFIPAHIEVCKASEQASQQNCSLQPLLLGIVAWANANNGFILSIATISIAIFTFNLNRSTGKLWAGGKKQIALARDEFISTHRPKLIVRQFLVHPPIPEAPIKSEFSIINNGSVKALVTHITAQVALWNGRYWEAPGINSTIAPLNPPITILNGQRTACKPQSTFNVTRGQMKAIKIGKLIICVVGEITYIDALGTERRTGCRRNYDVTTDMFVASPNPDQEYQD